MTKTAQLKRDIEVKFAEVYGNINNGPDLYKWAQTEQAAQTFVQLFTCTETVPGVMIDQPVVKVVGWLSRVYDMTMENIMHEAAELQVAQSGIEAEEAMSEEFHTAVMKSMITNPQAIFIRSEFVKAMHCVEAAFDIACPDYAGMWFMAYSYMIKLLPSIFGNDDDGDVPEEVRDAIHQMAHEFTEGNADMADILNRIQQLAGPTATVEVVQLADNKKFIH